MAPYGLTFFINVLSIPGLPDLVDYNIDPFAALSYLVQVEFVAIISLF
jgi:hypothetical protein